MALNISEIRSALALGGARPSLFNVIVTPPAGGLGLSSIAVAKIPFLCSAASLPESTMGVIEVPYYGRKIKVYGNRTFQPWTINILNDEDFVIRNFFEEWMSEMNSLEGNSTEFTDASILTSEGSAIVTQLSKTGLPLRSYDFTGIWPSDVSPIPVDWAAVDQIESFQVTLQYDYYSILGVTGIINN